MKSIPNHHITPLIRLYLGQTQLVMDAILSREQWTTSALYTNIYQKPCLWGNHSSGSIFYTREGQTIWDNCQHSKRLLECFLKLRKIREWKWKENYNSEPGERVQGHCSGVGFPGILGVTAWLGFSWLHGNKKMQWNWRVTIGTSKLNSGLQPNWMVHPDCHLYKQQRRTTSQIHSTDEQKYTFISMFKARLRKFLYEEISFFFI